ncbi:hypothetical protein I0600191H4_18130 [Collinsella sp. i06-0019-1H4]
MSVQSAGSETIRPRAFLYLPKPSAAPACGVSFFARSPKFYVKMTAPPVTV